MSVLLARLKARNPRIGLKVKDYSLRFNSPGSPYHGQWFDFRQAMVWYKVPAEVGEVLRRTAQDPYRPSPLIFDVCTEAEALQLDQQARLERERLAAVAEPSVATAVDLTGGLSQPAQEEPAPPQVAYQPSAPVVPQPAPVVPQPAMDEEVARSRAAALQATRPPEPDPDLAEPSLLWTRAKLVERATELGLKIKKDWNKPTILQLIQDQAG